MDITIRRASLQDINAIILMQQDLAGEDALWGYVADSADARSSRPLDWLYLALTGSMPIGFIDCAERAYGGECVFASDSRILEMMEFYVKPAFRQAGVGRRLVAAVEEQARAVGFSHLRLYSAAKRFDDMLRFYRQCGFTPWYLEMTKTLS